jgi:hypothetical protein
MHGRCEEHPTITIHPVLMEEIWVCEWRHELDSARKFRKCIGEVVSLLSAPAPVLVGVADGAAAGDEKMMISIWRRMDAKKMWVSVRDNVVHFAKSIALLLASVGQMEVACV